jgi:iron-sulfur cluster repair protein YtfE (RIC family)
MVGATEQLQSLIDHLSAEHADLLPDMDLLLELSAGGSSALREAVEACSAKLREPLDSHIIQEDTILFPSYANVSGGDGLVSQFIDEHRQILALRDDLLRACESGDGETTVKVAGTLAELLGDHMRREDMMLFPAIRDALN